METTANRVMKNTGFLYLKMSITMFISLWTTRVILNSLGADDFGIFSTVGGAIAFLGFLNSTMVNTTQRFMNYAEGEGKMEKKKVIFNVSIVLHLITAFIFCILLLIGGVFYFNGVLDIPSDRIFAAKVVYACLMVSTMFTVMTVPYDATINAHENMKYYAIIGVVESLLKLGVAYATVFASSDKLVLYGILMACIPLITLTVMRIYCHRHYEECHVSLKRYWDKNMAKEITSFVGWNFMGSTSSLLGNYGLGIVLNHFHGVIANAAHGIATQVNGMLMVFSLNMQKSLNPVIAKSEGAGQRERMIRLTLTGNKITFCLFAFFSIPAIIEMPYLLRIWLKNVPQYAIIFTQLVLVRTLIEQTIAFFNTAIGAEGHISGINKVTIFTNFIPVVVSIILFSYGYPAVWLYIVSIMVFGILNIFIKTFFMVKNCKMELHVFLRQMFLPLLAAIAIQVPISLLPSLLMNESFIRLLLTIIISSITFIIAFGKISLNHREYAMITSTIKAKLRL